MMEDFGLPDLMEAWCDFANNTEGKREEIRRKTPKALLL